jgi:hypothetical protein
MKNMKITIAMLVVLMIAINGNGFAGDKTKEVQIPPSATASIKPLELKLLWSKKLDWALAQNGLSMSDDGKRIVITTNKETKTNEDSSKFITKIEIFDDTGKLVWSKTNNYPSFHSTLSGNGKYLLMQNYVDEGVSRFIYFDETGKILWNKVIDGNERMSPDGEYIGFSGIYGVFTSSMAWYELRDKNYRLQWKYKPKY